MNDLFQCSIDIIRAGQSPNGAYVASPTFSQYQACWMRDGALTAYSMDCVGEHASARRFYEWASQTLSLYTGRIDTILAKLASGEIPDESEYLPTRFSLDGGLMPGHWWDFQLDGYGAWLWALVEHLRMTGGNAFYAQIRPIVSQIVRYLAALWPQPNYDCWEENRQQIHISTLAAIYGGLSALANYDPALATGPVAAQIREFVRAKGTVDGHFVKYLGESAVDGSLLWLAVPYGLVDVHDPVFQGTLGAIERDLHYPGGGVYRYRADVYYGGGEWILLAAWHGWAHVRQGRHAEAEAMLRWIEAQADRSGLLPEQVADHMLHPEHLKPWTERWGTSAKPLLWSHAMYLILRTALNGQRS
jgi:GH15 family glucan-1,4-alpha-glucosidase